VGVGVGVGVGVRVGVRGRVRVRDPLASCSVWAGGSRSRFVALVLSCRRSISRGRGANWKLIPSQPVSSDSGGFGPSPACRGALTAVGPGAGIGEGSVVRARGRSRCGLGGTCSGAIVGWGREASMVAWKIGLAGMWRRAVLSHSREDWGMEHLIVKSSGSEARGVGRDRSAGVFVLARD
jgi:hypothetical protein